MIGKLGSWVVLGILGLIPSQRIFQRLHCLFLGPHQVRFVSDLMQLYVVVFVYGLVSPVLNLQPLQPQTHPVTPTHG